MPPNITAPVFKSRDFHHVGVIVKDMEKTIKYLESIGIGPFGVMNDRKWVEVSFQGELHGNPAEWKVKISSAKVGGTEIELLEPSGGASALQEFLGEVGEGVHHIAFMVDNLTGVLDALHAKGIVEQQRAEYDGGRYIVVDSKEMLGVSLNLKQEP